MEFEVAYNASVHRATAHTTFFLYYGVHPRTIPAEFIVPQSHPSFQESLSNVTKSSVLGRENIFKKNVQMAKYANLKRIDCNFKVGDEVLLPTKNLKLESGNSTRKFHPKYCGIFKIIKQVSPVLFRIGLSQSMLAKSIHDTFHTSLLQPCIEYEYGREKGPQPDVRLGDESLEYEVENIIDRKKKKDKIFYFVKWAGYPDHENTWKPPKPFKNAQDKIQLLKMSIQRLS